MSSLIPTTVLAASVSGVAPILIAPMLRRLGVVDVATHRSSHRHPTLRGAGLAPALGILIAVTISLAFVPSERDLALGAALLVAAAGAASIGFVEDARGLSVRRRLAAQFAVGAIASAVTAWAFGAPLALVALGAVLVPGLVNVTNFMDGIDGISALHGIVFGVSLAILGALSGHSWLLGGGLAVAAAFAVFLPWNVLGQKMFLGDVGSYVLGATVAVLMIGGIAAQLPPVAVVAPITPYAADAAVTLFLRLRRGQHWATAHREHAYQILSRGRLGHRGASTAMALTSAICGAIGLMSYSANLPLQVAAGVAILTVTGGTLTAARHSPERRRYEAAAPGSSGGAVVASSAAS
jgi:UDP-N-acetylmuramyl pentapeptide phosphotransferase/UDP-N-acetylglucosamine-1-phosphate transferase